MQIPKWILPSFLAVSFLGFLDATYLTVKHYSGTPLNCSIFNGCDVVTTSQYATILGFPTSLLGIIYYLAVIVLLVAYIDSRNKRLLYLTARFTIVGFVISLWFVSLQIFVLKAFCFYCLLSAVTSTALFVLGLITLNLKNR